ncbi:hypothetical protein SAMN04488518_11348 [Pseudovibrio ascidiaceicola]|uniref:Uncharacterized protein n=1 Tax=Pseudovibrio ascidiaceicola TaxID=285279 RepID=A0A1I4DX29_9HYPH|nr:hypothetical protein [Pseudovibrio ascidiaceicola]SFK98208.1 hypothetical protein SAMN04488518_11348 [Pseudovibrio ascidiaceicola]
MSLTQSLNEVVQSTKDLIETVKTTYSQHDVEIQKILAVAPELQRVFYVDAVNGSDENDGSENAPFRRLKKAADLVPRHGRGHIYLLSDYHMTEPVFAHDCHLNIFGNKDVFRKVTFEQYSHGTDGNDYRAFQGFRWVGSGYFNFCYLDMVLPVLDPQYNGLPTSNYASIVSCATSSHTGNQGVTFRYGDIRIPTAEEGTPAGHILGHYSPISVYLSNVTASGASLKERFSRNDRARSYTMNFNFDELP